ncbi:uncharacterized protein LOC141614141 [Silene latifolia]|uniref:uncharacterized protein LOC141614141 n=1 Tax=Silene latifolia TaxID=37657 RepID=UPI003D77B4D9
MLHGSMKEHYSKLGGYIAALSQGNPSSFFTLVTKPAIRPNPLVFQRFFICFGGLKQGWLLGCRKILCVDACFLKTFLGGQLITTVGRDVNEQMFPLAWAVVERENNDSYQWFFQELKKCLDEESGEGWTFISDEHQGRAKAYNEPGFEDGLAVVREVDSKTADAFLACNPKLFCRAFISTQSKNDVIVNNMAETFNAYIISARTKHLIYMLGDINRVALMQRLVKKKAEMEKKCTLVCPRVQDRLEKEKELAALCTPLPSSPTVYQVKIGIDSLTVDLEARTCTCRKWDLTGIPCGHAISAIFDIYGKAEEYVHDCYKNETYLRIYSASISPCTSERHWPKPSKRGRGRPGAAHNIPSATEQATEAHHHMTAQPTRIGRNGRVINSGRGGRGLRSDTSERGGRGGLAGRGGMGGTSQRRGRGGRVPQGFGILFDNHENTFTNPPRNMLFIHQQEATKSYPSTQAYVNQNE